MKFGDTNLSNRTSPMQLQELPVSSLGIALRPVVDCLVFLPVLDSLTIFYICRCLRLAKSLAHSRKR
jgi:hypothetical protein